MDSFDDSIFFEATLLNEPLSSDCTEGVVQTVLALIHDSACAERRSANNGSSLINGRRRRNNVLLLLLYSGSTNSSSPLSRIIVVLLENNALSFLSICLSVNVSVCLRCTYDRITHRAIILGDYIFGLYEGLKFFHFTTQKTHIF